MIPRAFNMGSRRMRAAQQEQLKALAGRPVAPCLACEAQRAPAIRSALRNWCLSAPLVFVYRAVKLISASRSLNDSYENFGKVSQRRIDALNGS